MPRSLEDLNRMLLQSTILVLHLITYGFIIWSVLCYHGIVDCGERPPAACFGFKALLPRFKFSAGQRNFSAREVVARSTRYVLRAFDNWGVIDDSRKKGEYALALPRQIADYQTAAWLLEAAVLSMPDASVDFTNLLKSPSLFPFQMARVYPEQLAESGRLEIVRHGLENVLVRVRPAGRAARKPRDSETAAKSPQP